MDRTTDANVGETAEEGSLRAWIAIYLKGIAWGAADAVPGVSGGTIALITGIYERLVAAIAGIDPSLLGYVSGLTTPAGWTALVDALVDRDVPFLLVLGAGIGTALVIVLGGMNAAVNAYPAPTYAFFFGLIGASAVVLYTHVEVDTLRRAVVAVAGFILAFLVSGEAATGVLPHTIPVVFLSGAIAITAMILPGISGSLILLLLGQYEFMSGVPGEFLAGLVGVLQGDATGAVVETGGTVVAFGAGAVIGLLSVAHVIRWALANYRTATLTFLVSLMVGALRLPVLKILSNTPRWTPGRVAVVVAAALVGGVAVLALDHFTDDLEY